MKRYEIHTHREKYFFTFSIFICLTYICPAKEKIILYKYYLFE